ncbi:aminotransferase [Enterococcus florum]|uniref:Aminotransferase n=1 Tax=Enterococcus florum TaxID=2480627 RepID=A0A4P5PH15_9ENTE|nr:aminotransferase [Enterococcus florum]GCF94952.1 aminotransferase [Enterococcus florum]
MKIDPFKVELWMNEHEEKAIYNTGETCVDSISIDQLFEIAQINKAEKVAELMQKRLTYGHIFGNPAFKEGICSLYQKLSPQNVLTTHGAIGANHLALYSLVESEDEVVAVLPTYQQLYSIPKSFRAAVKSLTLTPENQFLPDLDQLKQLVTEQTKLIVINNPNNPAGSLMDRDMLLAIIEIAKSVDAYILSDETYRGLTQEDVDSPSIADLYEKGISVSSMSKVFSLAGLRLGWIASQNAEIMEQCALHRDHNTISCGLLDEEFAAIALANQEKILARNKRIVRENLQILDAWVEKEPHISYVKPQAGTVTLLYYDFEMSSRELCIELIDNHGILFTPGDCFEFEHCVRIGYACDTEELKAGLAKFSEYLAQI